MKEKTRTQYAFLNIATGLGGYLINTILGFVCRMVFVRCLAQEYLGINGLFTNVLSMLSLAELGIGSAIVYALYKPLAENNQKKIAILVEFYRKAYMLIGLLVAVIGLILMPFIPYVVGEYSFKENIYVIYLLYLFASVSSYFFSYRSSLLQAAQKQYLVTGASYICTIFQSIFQMIFLLVTHEYMYYLVLNIVSSMVYNIFVSYLATKEYPFIKERCPEKLSKEELKDISKNVWYLLTNKLASLLVSSTDNIITSYFQGLVTVGMASNYNILITTLNNLLSQLFNGLTGGVGNFNVLKSEEETEQLFYSMNFANFWFYGLGAIGIALVSSDMVAVFFTSKYVLDLRIPIVLALNFYLVGLLTTVWIFKSALGQFKYGRYVVLLTGILNIIFSIILGRIWGLFGIYLATIIARLLTNAWYEPYALFKYKLHRSAKGCFIRVLEYTLVMIVAFVVCYFVCNLIDLGTMGNLIYHFCTVLILTNVIFYAFFRKVKEFEFFKSKAVSLSRILVGIIK